MTKKAILAIMCNLAIIGASSFMWYFAGHFIKTPFFWIQLEHVAWIPLIMLILGIGLVTGSMGLIISLRIEVIYIIYGYIVSSLFPFLLIDTDIFVIFSALSYFAFLMFTHITSMGVMHNSIRLSLWSSLSPALGKMIFLIIISMSLLIYKASEASVDTFTFTMSDEFSYQFIDMLTKGNTDMLVQQPSTGAVGDVNDMDSILNATLARMGIERSQLTAEQEAQLIQQIESQLRQPAAAPPAEIPKETIYPIIKTQIEEQMNNLIIQYRPYIPLISSFMFFTAVNLFHFGVLAVAIASVWLALYIMRTTNVITIAKKMREIDEITY